MMEGTPKTITLKGRTMKEFSQRVNDMINRGWIVIQVGHHAPNNDKAKWFYWAKIRWVEDEG